MIKLLLINLNIRSDIDYLISITCVKLKLIIENLQLKELQLIAELLTVAQNAEKEATSFIQ